jgi:hypothetical protein
VYWSFKPADVPGAINWGDLGCREVQEVINDERRWYRVIIEEADPANPALHAAVLAGLVALGWTADDIEIETACNHPENNQYCQSRYRRATMNTDTDRREATDLWTIQLREQQLRELRAQLALVERYGADQWRRGNAGREPQEFAEWRREVQRD